MEKISVLLAGESWVSSSTHFKGWDFFSSTVYETGVNSLEEVLTGAGIDFNHMPAHLAAVQFPTNLDDLNQFDVVILSDLGANTLLLHPDTWLHGKSIPNRLKLIREWVRAGGGLIMCGGYYSFSGIYGQAKYYHTPVEEALPVNIHTYDDRIEAPEGAIPEIVEPDHPILRGIPSDWPYLLGFNELMLKDNAQLLAKIEDYPLLAVWKYGAGKSMIWASDIGPHWCPVPFTTWKGYGRLWLQSLHWLTDKSS